ncbi:hypothetical protein [Streptomyces sp. BE133]|uniref:hypothetical protein n=1 Tax=Streptomyces sp. BE133 TaxID=3002523 RepID=UPI002E79F2E4|nr:hypothetical protein [Streptomyces sp. BE133]MEE1806800.1 hypothetical protein [Streptomyces sp. BE133]
MIKVLPYVTTRQRVSLDAAILNQRRTANTEPPNVGLASFRGPPPPLVHLAPFDSTAYRTSPGRWT